MRRVAHTTASAVAITVVALLVWSAVRSWTNPEPQVPTDASGQPLVTAVQPQAVLQPATAGMRGFDVSYPQCRSTLPPGTSGFGIVGLNRGKPFTSNPCFARQWEWALRREAAAVYINMADPGTTGAADYGVAVAKDAMQRMRQAGVPADTTVWLDVETNNTWSGAQRAVHVIDAALATLTAAGHPVGVYSAPAHWFEITLNATIEVPVWLALGRYTREPTGREAARAACRDVAFGHALPTMVQYVAKRKSTVVDHNVRCGS